MPKAASGLGNFSWFGAAALCAAFLQATAINSGSSGEVAGFSVEVGNTGFFQQLHNPPLSSHQTREKRRLLRPPAPLPWKRGAGAFVEEHPPAPVPPHSQKKHGSPHPPPPLEELRIKYFKTHPKSAHDSKVTHSLAEVREGPPGGGGVESKPEIAVAVAGKGTPAPPPGKFTKSDVDQILNKVRPEKDDGISSEEAHGRAIEREEDEEDERERQKKEGNIKTPGVKPTLPPGEYCEDSSTTSIKFASGLIAVCSDLLNYCDHNLLGDKVRASCPRTCGMCSIAKIDPAEVKPGCYDFLATESPEITVAGRVAACSELLAFCSGHPDSAIVSRKCPRSCNVCEKPPDPTPPPTMMEEALDENPEGQDSMVNCVRRRRWGFCYTRRRRDTD